MVETSLLLHKVPLHIDHLRLVVLTTNFGKFAWKFSLNRLTKAFGMQLWMDHTLLNTFLITSKLTSHGINGHRRKESVHNMIVQQRTFSPLHWAWMSSLKSLNAKVKKTCWMCLKSHMREQMMWRQQGSMLWYRNMSCSRCNKENQLLKCKRD